MIEKLTKTNEEWKKLLSPLQYHILREKGTEPAFANVFLENEEPGFYHCVACDNKLFSSDDKYNSGTGWPSFSKPITEKAVIIAPYPGQGTDGAEVLCARCEGHLGHAFLDGPEPTGQRFCMNTAVLKFNKRSN
ncbi:MAG: peptide-methionine (R)-S-oxide reductase MsrB [Candidatus Portnoybacteria bacterium]|nr:peptide-methionine (R)-S-oxide reductase MsrB [Candidatus Portnoybacteria bacterium]